MTLKKTHRINAALLAAWLLGAGCSSSPAKKPEASPGSQSASAAVPFPSPQSSPLTREQAWNRSRQISGVSYNLWFGLDSQDSVFEGRIVVRFELKSRAKDHGSRLFLDFSGGKISRLSINGKIQEDLAGDDQRYDGSKIYLKLSELSVGSNRIEIAYTHPYSQDGHGLHRFKDPVDGRVYFYTDLEPDDARRVFPCFDQPDLKASFEVTVETPEGWQVVSNTLEREVSRVDGRLSWAFPPSPVLSTYVFAMHAGQYALWKTTAQGIPMRLFARKSIAQYINPEDWFQVARKGLEFYGTEFGFPYPYAKYDQIIVPEFNAGAMENAAAVTFSETFVDRSKPTREQVRHRAEVILHEMAHMWFGDLVTMRWWNGLWLNESFATFLAAIASKNALEQPGAWEDFFVGSKRWAYWEDQLTTTHPIEVPVSDTDQAFANFDGITYGKGASVLKQLRAYLGEDDFREGLQRYFQKYAFRNTSLQDFMRVLGEASGKNLAAWQKQWLLSTGVNTVRAQWACTVDERSRRSKISQFTLLQSEGELRQHQTEIALYQWLDARKTKLKLSANFKTEYAGPETQVTEAIGKPCPDFVFPNHDDQDYVKIQLDPQSLSALTQPSREGAGPASGPAAFSDPLMRLMTWHLLKERVTDGMGRASELLELATRLIGPETDSVMLGQILKDVHSPLAVKDSLFKALDPSLREAAWSAWEQALRKKLQASPVGSDLQLVAYLGWASAARSPSGVEELAAIYQGKKRISGVVFDQERRWELLHSLSRAGHPQALAWVAEELKKDATEMGQTSAASAEAAFPSIENKRRWMNAFRLFATEGTGVLSKLKSGMRSYQLIGQEELTAQTADLFYETLELIARRSGTDVVEFASRFTQWVAPALCEQASLNRLSQYAGKNPALPPKALKNLKIQKQEVERCIRARGLGRS